MTGRYWVPLLLVFWVGASGCEVRLEVGATCTYDSECASPLSCRLGRCREQCLTNRDCGAGGECWLSEGTRVCRVPAEAMCDGTCFGGLLCVTGACRAPCIDETDCVADSECGMIGTERVCVPDDAAPDAGTRDGGPPDAAEPDAGRCTAGSCEYGPCVAGACDDAVTVTAGFEVTCVLRRSGQLDCTGGNDALLLGAPTPARRASFAPIPGLPEVVEADVGWRVACARTEAGAAWCWGVLPAAATATPVEIVTPPLTRVRNGILGACGVSATQVLCWGTDSRGELGDAMIHPSCPTDTHCSAAPVVVEGIDGARVRDLDVGYEHACVVLDDGSARCWGSDENGRLGLGAAGPDVCMGRSGPIACAQTPQVVMTTERFAQVACGFYHSCARTESGRVFCWGSGTEGQIGLGNRDDQAAPTLVPGLNEVEQVVAGAATTCAIQSGGGLWCWGSGADDQLLGAPLATSPIRLMPGGVVEVSVGGGHVCARTDAGRVLCWGADLEGQIGDGEPSPSERTPVAVRVLGLDR